MIKWKSDNLFDDMSGNVSGAERNGISDTPVNRENASAFNRNDIDFGNDFETRETEVLNKEPDYYGRVEQERFYETGGTTVLNEESSASAYGGYGGINPQPKRKFCGYCGNPMSEGEKFCAKCGKPVSSAGFSRTAAPVGTPGYARPDIALNPNGVQEKIPLYISLVTAVIVLVSPFLQFFNFCFNYYIDEDFTIISMIKFVNDYLLKYVLRDETGFIVAFCIIAAAYVILYILSIVSIVETVANLSSADINIMKKTYKRAYRANSAIFAANLFIYAVLVVMNLIIGEFDFESTFAYFTPYTSFYIMEIISILGYAICKAKYIQYKKLTKAAF